MSEFIRKHCPELPEKVSYKGVTLKHGDILIFGDAESWPKAYGCKVELTRDGQRLIKDFIRMKPYSPARPVFWLEGKGYIYEPKNIKMSECFTGSHWALSGKYRWDENELRFVKAR